MVEFTEAGEPLSRDTSRYVVIQSKAHEFEDGEWSEKTAIMISY